MLAQAMEVSTRYPTQPHLFENRPSAFPAFDHQSRSSYHSREMPLPYAQSHHQAPAREQSRITLPPISDLLNFTGSDNVRQSQSSPPLRTAQSWQQPRTFEPQLKVETANMDHRLHRPLLSPAHGSTQPSFLQRSPVMQSPSNSARSADAEYVPHQFDYDHHKRLSTVSQMSHMSHTSTQSASSTHSSPSISQSSSSAYSHRGSLGDQRGLEFPPLPHSPQRRVHSPIHDAHHPYAHPSSQRPTAHYPQQVSQRPPLVHQVGYFDVFCEV